MSRDHVTWVALALLVGVALVVVTVTALQHVGGGGGGTWERSRTRGKRRRAIAAARAPCWARPAVGLVGFAWDGTSGGAPSVDVPAAPAVTVVSLFSTQSQFLGSGVCPALHGICVKETGTYSVSALLVLLVFDQPGNPANFLAAIVQGDGTPIDDIQVFRDEVVCPMISTTLSAFPVMTAAWSGTLPWVAGGTPITIVLRDDSGGASRNVTIVAWNLRVTRIPYACVPAKSPRYCVRPKPSV